MSIEEYMPFRASPTVLVLIIVNLISVYGIFAWNWDLFIILLLFWLENIIIGLINLVKILAVNPKDIVNWVQKLFIVPFFVVHYGAFTAGHGLIILTIFGEQTLLMKKLEEDPSIFFSEMMIMLQEYSLLWVLLAILLSHIFSFVWNFIRKEEWKKTTVHKQMILPYARVFVLHFLVIVGGIVALALSAPSYLLVLIVLLKIVVDVRLHVRSHANKNYKWFKV